MADTGYFISICIPSYNRPEELYRLLRSIDISDPSIVEIVVCEDKAPRRDEVREKVLQFKSESQYTVNYIENEENCGYDKNLRQCILNAHGRWIMYMGDDDMFVPGAMDGYLEFLRGLPQDTGYVLRSYQNINRDGSVERFDYFGEDRIFEPGVEAYTLLFRKSVFISGFCFVRENALENLTDRFDGSLLYQLYIQAEICMSRPSAYYCTPITQAYSYEGTPFFGTSESEKDLYTPGTVTVDNSVNFVSRFFMITDYMDGKYGLNSTQYVQNDMSKYAYPILSIQRNRGRKEFRKYAIRLKEIGIGGSLYFKLYYLALLVFGVGFCDWLIRTIKKVLGKTPKL